MKRFFTLMIALALLAPALCACSGGAQTNALENKLNIVCTIFPEYDWVKNILGDNPADAELTLLLDKGVDMHSYQPSADDMIKISSCDMLVYVGGESDTWVDDALREAVNKDMTVVNLMDILGANVKEEELAEGMEAEAGEDEEEEEKEYDEHVWLSLKNAQTLCTHIAKKLCMLDPVNANAYTANFNAYLEKLSALDKEYQSAVDGAKKHTLIFADRFPFRYLTDDYGLDYYAAFPGCSAETEASFETVAFLAGKTDELSVKCLLTIEGAKHDIAKTVIDNTQTKDQKILTLDSMQSTTLGEAESGTSYISIMQSNLDVIREALD